jgi:gliding motility-associated-like protein
VTSNVTIGAPPTPTVNNATICAGNTATLTATGGVSYLWSTGATTTSITTGTAGNYTVTATNAGGCTATASGTVTVNPLPTPTVTSAAACAGNTATITASGGLSYLWSTGATTTSITTGTAGIYTVTATDVNTCSATASGTITINPLPTPTVNNATVCAGNPATLTATGGSSYLWSTGAATTSITTGTAGIYTVTASDINSCSATASGTITVNALPTPTVNNATVCAGTNATLTATGGTGYQWSTGAVTATITTGTAGIYTVTATNAAGCTATASGTVTVNPLPTPGVTSAAACAGNTATITASGGLSYLWSTGATTTSITTGTAGIYTVTATDVNTCSATASGTITINPLPTPTVNNATVCAGNTATLTATGGSSYLWSTGAATTSITTGTAGIYTVTASDINSCSATASGTVTVNPLPTPSATSATVCSGDNATLTASGGVGYLWSTGDVTPSITTATAGIYTVTATDINGCTATATGTVQLNPLPTPTATSATVCAGNSGTLTASGGVSYLWSTGDVTAGISVSTAGIYTVTATDGNGCSATASGTLTVNPLPTPGVNNPAVCTGNNATLTATGGVSYQWSTGDLTQSITTATAGTYTVTATDANGCSATASGTVTLNPLPVVSVNTTPAVCTTASGTAIAIVSSGTPGYGYAWSAQAGTDDTLSGLTAGTYTVLVTDVNGCTATAAGIVSQLSPGITVNETSQHDLSCNNDASGAIYISATDIAGPGPFNFTYNWGSSSSQDLTGVQAGSYSVTVTDQFGCSGTASYTLTQPTPLTGSTTSVNPACFGQSNGSATLTPSGGSPNYTYAWSTTPVQTTAQATGLPAGTYTIVLTDDSLCQATFTVTLTEPQQITFGDSTITNPSCFAAGNGSAQVAPQNGIGSYTYLWSTNPAQMANPATGLASGSYIVTVSDNNLCTASTTVTLTAPSQVSVAAVSTNVSCAGYNNGTATATATGGTPPYSYIWNDQDSTAGISGLPASTYSVTATDANGCTANNSTTLTAPVAISESLTSVRTNCPNTDDGSITAMASGGTGTLSYTLDSGTTAIQSGNTTGSFTNIGYGLYTVVVTDANGCQVSDTITVPRAPFNYYTDTATGTSCYGSQYTDGTIHLQGYSIPNGPFNYSIDGGKTFQSTADFFNLAAGTYTIIAQDAYGCDTSFSIVVPEPLPATVQILPGDSTITAGTTLQLYTSFGPYSIDSIRSYSWSPGTGLSCIDCSGPQVSPYSNVSTYTVLVTYNQGCTASASVQITVNGEPPVYVPNAFTPNGDGVNDVWYVYGTGIKDMKAMIFDRWGEKVFESDDQSIGWDGTFRGQMQSPDVYIYLVNIVYLDGTTTSKQGSVTLIR